MNMPMIAHTSADTRTRTPTHTHGHTCTRNLIPYYLLYTAAILLCYKSKWELNKSFLFYFSDI